MNAIKVLAALLISTVLFAGFVFYISIDSLVWRTACNSSYEVPMSDLGGYEVYGEVFRDRQPVRCRSIKHVFAAALGTLALFGTYFPHFAYALTYTGAAADGSFVTDSGPTYSITTQERDRSFNVWSGNFLATAEADLTGNTRRVLAAYAGGIAHKPGGAGYEGNEGSVSFDVSARAGIEDTWSFSRACGGGPCTTPWSFAISTNVTGDLDSNSLLAPEATYQIHWGGYAPSDFAGNATQVGTGNVNAFYRWQGDQTVNETGVWTWNIPSHVSLVDLTITAELYASARGLSTYLLENEDAVIRSRVAFSNSAGFTFDLPQDVTFSSSSGVTPSPVPLPGAAVLFTTGLSLLAACRRQSSHGA